MGNSPSNNGGSNARAGDIIADSTSPEYWRERGDQLARARNEAFAGSKAAYLRGDHTTAGKLSRQGKEYARQSDAAHSKAAALFLQRNNPGAAATGADDGSHALLDLHGLRVKEAIAVVRKALARGRAMGHKQLVLVVGRGLHSPGGISKLRPAIEQMVQRHNVRATPGVPNEGCITIEFVTKSERGWVGWLADHGCVIC
ncbi:hypothetical protein Vretimale_11608 [Volvox reticuliferus]|uniref:Smr domain-containing protein n=1 Tax=Volvox reticuliferus TaxID=1737510 RepID=A0A8J4FQY0_9CHLO|nr:hypothetical protein Vretifemale_14815 [Volvox reticuliferus]GIM07487.1 hypothetical protein Vretimale_11608 [Volvox reticuliferus]